MSEEPKRRWPRFTLQTLYVVVTVVGGWLSGQWWLVAVGFAWGVWGCCAMHAGMRIATLGAWERKHNRLTSGFLGGAILLALFLPAVVTLMAGGLVLGLAQMAAIALGMCFAHAGCNWLFGPIPRPTHY